MMTRVLRGVLVLVCAGTLVAGCKSSSQAAPAEQSAAPVDTGQAQEPVAPARTDANGNPIDMATGQPLARTFYFDFDQAVIRPEDQPVLSAHAAFLREFRNRSIVVSGHCDERGTREYNMALGERRSDAVSSYLIAQGVDAAQIRTVSYGEEQPVDTGHDESAWSRNRRAQMDYR